MRLFAIGLFCMACAGGVLAQSKDNTAAIQVTTQDDKAIAAINERIQAIEENRIEEAMTRAEANANKMVGWAQICIGVITLLSAIALAFMAFDWWSIRYSARTAKADAANAKQDAEKAKKDALEAQKIVEEMRKLSIETKEDNSKTMKRMEIIRKHTEAVAEKDEQKKKALFLEVQTKYQEWLKEYPNEPETGKTYYNLALALDELADIEQDPEK